MAAKVEPFVQLDYPGLLRLGMEAEH